MKQIAYLALGVLSLCSCSKSSPTAAPNAATTSQVKSGSIFRFENHALDSTNAVVVDSRDTLIDTVAQTNVAVNGKSNVFYVNELSTGSGTTTTLMFAYESNGDVTIMPYGGQSAPTPITLPVASKQTTYAAASNGTATIDSTICSYVGTENLLVNGTSLSTVKIKMHTQETISGVLVGAVDAYLSYVPALGYLARIQVPSVKNTLGEWLNGSDQTLFSYSLK